MRNRLENIASSQSVEYLNIIVGALNYTTRPLRTWLIALIGMIILSASPETHAAKWVRVLDADDETYFIDSSLIKRTGERSKSTVLVNYKVGQQIEGVTAWSTALDAEFDCLNAKVAFNKAEVYESTMGGGTARATIKLENNWRDNKRPPFGALIKAACKNK
jgi:hypothetical protein